MKFLASFGMILQKFYKNLVIDLILAHYNKQHKDVKGEYHEKMENANVTCICWSGSCFDSL
ncbi:hypothetical protein SGADD02_00074 [Streptococcus gallolyticus]|uniref:Uncharacterized protein n=1 Tax=Streptococcus gallolyticus TaxID=315405 RepID=A0A139NDI0_9STRE|nr:hypothetical protein SGADD02_00074 [Streptococcus gallolyticus]